MRIIFFLQGEGRGHLTQALTLKSIFESAGHEVVAAFVGRSERREVPSFFAEAFPDALFTYQSPNFVTDAQDQGILLGKSIVQNVRKMPTFWRELATIHQHLEALKPDVVFNFYDILPSVYHLLYRPKHPFVCIANQYMIHHPDYATPRGYARNKALMKLFSWATAWRSTQKWALSLENVSHIPRKKLFVMPPLIRDEVRTMPIGKKEDFFLGYVVNNGYAEQLLAWQKSHPETRIHFFWDNRDVPEIYEPQPNFTFHRVDQAQYQALLEKCKAIVGTAGFQTTCEAMYLQKPFIVLAVANQYEQLCNATFIHQKGYGIHVDSLNLDAFLAQENTFATKEYDAAWFDADFAQKRFVEQLERVIEN